MTGRVALVTDSASYLPDDLVSRYGIEVVPLRVQIDGVDFLEPDIEPTKFYERLAGVRSISTSQPSPGRFLDTYRRAADDGAESVLSVHIGSNVSGTVGSARLAAESSPIPVSVVDTGQASFAEGLCVLEAAEALSLGSSVEEAASLAQRTAPVVGNTFVVRGFELARRGGRLIARTVSEMQGVPVMELASAGMQMVGTATTLENAVDLMSSRVKAASDVAGDRKLRVGVGHGGAPEIAAALHARFELLPGVAEIIDYTVGPAVGAHLGAGTAGAVFVARPIS
jgi:DegV family protein with EDD domain